MRTSNLIVIVFLGLCWSSIGQQNMLIGSWKSYLPQQLGRKVVQTSDKIIYATPWNLISIDKQDLSADFIGKVEGLSDIGIGAIAYDQFNDQLAISYTNSNIDFLTKNGDVINVPNIKENSNIAGDKTINDIYINNSEELYFATGFGVVSFDTERYVFGATVNMGIRVNAISADNGFLYAATEEGLYRISLGNSVNFSDFTLWEYLSGQASGLPSLTEILVIEVFMNQIFLGTSEGIYYSDDGGETFMPFHQILDRSFRVRVLKDVGEYLVMGYVNDNFQSQVYFVNSDKQIVHQTQGCSNTIGGVEIDNKGRVWYADELIEIRYSENITESCKKLSFNSPYYHTVSDIDIKGNTILACDGGVTDNFQYLFSRQGFYVLDNNAWTNYNEYSIPFIRDNDLLSFFRIKAHPKEDKIYVGSYWGGLLELDRGDNSYKLFTQENSSLQGTLGDDARERISGIAFDDDDNMWVTTFGAPNPLNVMTTDGNWYNFSVVSPRELSDVTIDQFGYKWSPVAGISGGVLVYDSGADPTNTTDDRQKFINSSNSGLPTNRVNTIEVDREGAVWVGTSEGPVIFDCGEDVFDDDCTGIRKKVEEGGIIAFLLADQDIQSIAVDGANQKWLGTRNGIFVQSADGEKKVDIFNSENSPLFDNFIPAMAYDGVTGIMYIGTNKGLMAYQTNTTKGSSRHIKSEVFAYPNPVQPDYRGPIAIKGLVEDAEVKITDINGHLVFKTSALGGQAIWNGKDLDGREVNSGVYLVFSNGVNTFTGPGAYVTKILLLR